MNEIASMLIVSIHLFLFQMPQECLELFNKLVENEFLRVKLDPKDDLFKLKLGITEMYGVLRLFHYKV